MSINGTNADYTDGCVKINWAEYFGVPGLDDDLGSAFAAYRAMHLPADVDEHEAARQLPTALPTSSAQTRGAPSAGGGGLPIGPVGTGSRMPDADGGRPSAWRRISSL